MLVSRTRNLPARCLRPLLFVEPRLQYLLPLPPFSLIRRAISLRLSPSPDWRDCVPIQTRAIATWRLLLL